jgi:excisionase family DNA binding protein
MLLVPEPPILYIWCDCFIHPTASERNVQGVRQPGTHAAEGAATQFMTRAEVSRLLGVSPNTVTRWAREGRVPCQVTLGGHHRFDRDVVEQLRTSLRRGSKP